MHSTFISSRAGAPASRLFIANRGEIALRIARTARVMGMQSYGLLAREETPGPLLTTAMAGMAESATAGPAAYLDQDALLELALAQQCDALHPGYGFLSESAAFAELCRTRGLLWIGADPENLRVFGDKAAALRLAREQGVPVIEGSSTLADLAAAEAFFHKLNGPGILKAVAGGGGRGMRIVHDAAELPQAFARAGSEARTAFGSGELYMERLLPRARHIEVQILADRAGDACHLGERECTLQRRHQKLIEIAPAPRLAPELRRALTDSALKLARAAKYCGVGTFEFLVPESDGNAASAGDPAAIYFIEANPRLQVEHTVTEEINGVDLVQAQILLAGGAPLDAIPGLSAALKSQAEREHSTGDVFAIQLRINAERTDSEGRTLPAGGRLTRFASPGGPGVRLDTAAAEGYEPAEGFDSLLAKLIVRRSGAGFAGALDLAAAALAELRVLGIETNRDLLASLLAHPRVREHQIYTRFIDDHLSELLAESDRRRANTTEQSAPEASETKRVPGGEKPSQERDDVGANNARGAVRADKVRGAVCAPMRGRILELAATLHHPVRAGEELAVLEAMKMEHVITAPCDGLLTAVHAGAGDPVDEGQLLFMIDEPDVAEASPPESNPGHAGAADPGRDDSDSSAAGSLRADLREVLERRAATKDASRPRAVAKRHKRGQRTARENIADLCDPGSFHEYGGFALAAQRRRRSLEDLIQMSPADGLVAGLGTVNAELFGGAARAPGGGDDKSAVSANASGAPAGSHPARCAVMSYDYTVFAGTQGAMNHKKTDRLLHIVRDLRLPFIVFAEGGGGRPGDTDVAAIAGLDLTTFRDYAALSGIAPRIAIASGRCFAGNAALFGCSDLTIATEDATIGMGGPVMVKGGGLGNFRAEEIGPASRQAENGVVDVLVRNEAEAVHTAKKALSYFQGSLGNFRAADQALLRDAVPERRLRAYDVRGVIELLADEHSVLELRRAFAPGMITALIRVAGRPMGLLANNPAHLAGAIDAPAADKAARFLQLCDAFDLPVLSLCDTPGIMVGPEAESQALVRHASRLFLAAGAISVPVFTIVLRKGYGLGAMAMAGGGFHAPVFTVAWPTGEFGAMGLEGAVSTGFQKELAEVKDWDERQQLFEKLVSDAYEQGKALNMATHLEIDDVIDPAASRDWIVRGLASLPPVTGWAARTTRKRMIDAW